MARIINAKKTEVLSDWLERCQKKRLRHIQTSRMTVMLRMVPPNTEMFNCKGYDYGEAADLSKTYWNLKRKMWVTAYFSLMMKQP